MGGALEISRSVSQFKIAQEVGWNLRGTFTGPAIGVVLQESFGSKTSIFSVQPKLWWRVQPLRRIGLYLSPYFQVGFAIVAQDIPFGVVTANTSEAGFNWQFGAQLHLMLIDRVYLMFQPLGIDLIHTAIATSVRYDLIFGAGATFP